MTAALELDRHELLWVFEQCGVTTWPYPLRPVHWAAETAEETTIHRGRTEQRLRARGLLAPASARVLQAAGEVARCWTLAADLVHRDARSPWAAVAVSDGARAWVLASREHAEAPVSLTPCDPEGLPEALLGLVGPGTPGRDGPWPVHADPPGADLPRTRRREAAHGAAAELVATATGFGQIGAAGRPTSGPADAVPRRGSRLVGWIDGPRGRYRLRMPAAGSARPPLLDPVNDTHLAADVRTVLAEAGTAGPGVRPVPPAPAARRVPVDESPGRSRV